MDLIIRAGEMEFFGHLPVSGRGFIIEPDGLDGLDDGVASRGDTISRPQAHGDFDVPAYLDSRIVSIAGTCLADTPQQLREFGSRFTGFLASGSERLTFEHMGRFLWATGSRAPGTSPKFKVDGTRSTEARFQVQLKFPNPRLFGDTRAFAGGVASYHYGNFPATPVHTITGVNAGGYTINGPDGRQFTVTTPVTLGNPHTVDMSTGFVSIGGVVVSGGVTSADLWSVPGGARVTHTLTGSGLTLSTAVTDTFV